jgi:type II secretory pathway component PulC
MSDSPVNSEQRLGGGSNNLLLILIFALGVFAGFLASAFINGKLPEAKKENAEKVATTNEPSLNEPSAGQQAQTTSDEHKGHANAGAIQEMSREKSEHEVVISRQTRDRLMTLDFLNLLQDAELRRYRFEGETKGLRLTKIRTGSFYDKAGFKDDDVIEEINGLAFADLEKSPQKAREDLPSADQLTVKVRRADKVIIIRIKVAGAAMP